MGSHTWKAKACRIVLSHEDIVGPANLNKKCEFFDVGVGSKVIAFTGKKIRITTLLGKPLNFTDIQTNPFPKMDEILQEDKSDIHIGDFHSGTTSEKNAFF